MRWLLLLFVIFFCINAAGVVAEKTTVDPNSPEARAAAQPETDETKPDTRLAQKITYQAMREPVRKVIADLAQMTGVTFRAGSNDSDWMVRDRKLIIFAKDLTLAELMSSIARVSRTKWQISDKDEIPGYRLVADQKAMSEAEKRQQDQLDKYAREQQEKRDRMIDNFEKVISMDENDLEKLRGDDPFLYLAAKTGIAKPLYNLMNSSPELLAAFRSGNDVTISASSLPPQALRNIGQIATSYADVAKRVTGGRENINVPANLRDSLQGATISLRGQEELRNHPEAGFALGEFRIKMEGMNVDLPMFDSKSAMGKAIGRAVLKAWEEEKSMDQMQGEFAPAFAAAVAEMRKVESGEPAAKHESAPDLQEKVKCEAQNNEFKDVVAALAKCVSYSIVSDCYSSVQIGNVNKQESKIEDVLRDISDIYRCNWEKRNTTIELRDRNWYKKLSAMIPDSKIEEWKNALIKTGTLDIDLLAEIASLTEEQIRENLSIDAVLRGSDIVGIRARNRDLLKLYGSLDQAEKTALFSPEGLSVGSLSGETYDMFYKLVLAMKPDLAAELQPVGVIKATRKKLEKNYHYTFSFTPVAGIDDVTADLNTPIYDPPKEELKADEKKENKPGKRVE